MRMERGRAPLPAYSAASVDILMPYKQKYRELTSELRACGKIAVAYSGGVDSSLLLYAAIDAVGAENVTAATIHAPFHSDYEIAAAKKLAAGFNCRHIIIKENDLLQDAAFCANPPDRCYLCKRVLFGKLQEVIQNQNAVLVDGSNADDLKDYRPGMRAVRELKVASPLQQAGLAKNEIRLLAREFGLSTWDRPSAPCLCSRIPYGSAITEKKLRQVEHGEDLLRQLGFAEARLRHHGNLARIEIPTGLMQDFTGGHVLDRVRGKLRELGFQYVTLDLHGLRSGSLNEVL
ncbi:ATP-dependent sacrificial sulfur transferase LarE [Desulfotruncus alcoholivorax]|uniref:ATP-dependent sacrificial sulfur transferase LarE n=1 Tax=Desulfotruncus alcoholivorax TaxID=265477 RepID=UPI001A98DE54|nr:ATP-dependent sacrificial sulfur transferase LarE [Desulfotruncus alcoholivorax]